MNIFGKRSDLPFSRKSDRKKEKSTVSITHEQNIICSQTVGWHCARLQVVPHFFLRDSRASETRASVKITPPEKGETRWGEREMIIFLSPRRVSPFLAWGDFHARSRLARSTIPKEKWGTTRSLEMIVIFQDVVVLNGVKVGTQESMKILEVTLDKKLTFKDHISRQLKKVYAKSAALLLIRRFQNSN